MACLGGDWMARRRQPAARVAAGAEFSLHRGQIPTIGGKITIDAKLSHVETIAKALGLRLAAPQPRPLESARTAGAKCGPNGWQMMANQGNSSRNRRRKRHCPNRPGHEKTPENTGFSGVFGSDADGTRTRNHRIDSPVL